MLQTTNHPHHVFISILAYLFCYSTNRCKARFVVCIQLLFSSDIINYVSLKTHNFKTCLQRLKGICICTTLGNVMHLNHVGMF